MQDGSHNRDDAYCLETPGQHQAYYDAWAKTYDADFADAEGYAYPARIALLAARLRPGFRGRVADIGCGTGLVGGALRRCGFDSAMDGLDISDGMLAEARRKSIYQGLHRVDLTDPSSFPPHRYQLLISAGTFTLGHLGPDTLEKALTLASRGGFAVIGINAAHFIDRGFAEAFTTWQAEARITPPSWFELGIYVDPDAVSHDSKTARVAAFTIT